MNGKWKKFNILIFLLTLFAGNGHLYGNSEGNRFDVTFGTVYVMAFNSEGDFFVADWSGNRICKISADGKVTTLAGSGSSIFANEKVIAASFTNPTGLVVDTEGNVYVSEAVNRAIRKYFLKALLRPYQEPEQTEILTAN